MQATVERFGHLDVLVNNAGSFNAGFFEEMSPQDFRAQIETTLFGPVNVTRAALPQMRAQRSGLVVTISSTAGIAAEGDFLTAYAASKFGVEGFMEGSGLRGRPVRHPHHAGRARLLPHRAAHPGVHHSSPSPPSRTTPIARTATVEAGRAWTASRAATPPSSPTPWSSSPRSMSRRCGSPPAPTPWGCSRPRPSTLLAQADAHRDLSSSLAHDDA